ncbi:hypothetical protein KUCAC02_029738 [Chaenocephalus aceratus]|nr:hypothetical protein KUCAC02_029738 [Chaenocephalus aceratus]
MSSLVLHQFTSCSRSGLRLLRQPIRSFTPRLQVSSQSPTSHLRSGSLFRHFKAVSVQGLSSDTSKPSPFRVSLQTLQSRVRSGSLFRHFTQSDTEALPPQQPCDRQLLSLKHSGDLRRPLKNPLLHRLLV